MQSALLSKGLKSEVVERLLAPGIWGRAHQQYLLFQHILGLPRSNNFRKLIGIDRIRTRIMRFLCSDFELALRVHVRIVSNEIPQSYEPKISIAKLNLEIMDLEVAEAQRDASRQGFYYIRLQPGLPYQIVDVDHTMHNFITKVIWGQDGHAPSLYLVSIEHLKLASEQLKDETLSKVIERSSDKHSHACSLFVATHRELQQKLIELGFLQGLTFGTRLYYLSRLRLTIYAIFGQDALCKVDVLRSQHTAGVPTNQLLDMLAAIDVFEHIYFALSPALRHKMNASSLTTRNLESSFSSLSSNCGSGEKNGHGADPGIRTPYGRACRTHPTRPRSRGLHPSAK